jgi:putative ABC transport system permease protein
MRTLIQDIGYALRLLRKNPGFTIIAVLTLALGLGANMAIFTMINAALLRPFNYQNPDQLVRVFETYQPDGIGTVAPANFVDWRTQNDIFAGVAAYRTGSRNIQAGEMPEHVTCITASANLFALLGISARLGRTFAPGEDEPNKPDVAIISHELWQRDYSTKEDVLGKTVRVEGRPYTIIGVMAPDFQFPPNVRADLWVPLQMSPGLSALRDTHFLSVIARLQAGVSLSQASSRIQIFISKLAAEYPKELKGRSAKLVQLHEQVVGDIRPKLAALMGAVLLVLLIACANLANLLLARAARRNKEVSIRIAIGASRKRLLRQLLTESIILSALGGIAALLIGWLGLLLIKNSTSQSILRVQNIGVDWKVIGFLSLLSLATGIIFGIAPALQALRTDIQGELRDDVTGYRQSKVRNGLVISEVALSLVLLVSTGLLMRSLLRLLNIQTGFDSSHVITMHLSVQPEALPGGGEVTHLYEPILEKISHLPGVKAAGITSLLPLQDWGTDGTFQIKGQPPAASGQEPSAELRIVSPDYFRALGIPLFAGRVFSPADTTTAPGAVIVNEALARKYFPTGDAIGRVLEPDGDVPKTIVGVVGNVRQVALNSPPVPELYYADTQAASGHWFLGDVVLVMKSANNPAYLIGEIRSTVQQIKTDEPIFDVETMDEVISRSISDKKLYVALLSVFAALALVLAAVGLYGVMSYVVSQRTREFGIRMALGATHGQVFGLILREEARIMIAGIGAGFILTLIVTHYLRTALFGIAPTDITTFIVSVALVFAIGLCAGFVPALRARKTAPISALRYQ